MFRLYGSIMLVLGFTGVLPAQSSMGGPPSSTAVGRDSVADTVKPSMEAAHGLVVKAGGSPEDLIEIHAICGGTTKLIAMSDTHGRYDVNLADLKSPPDPRKCVLRAFLDGYRSESIALTEIRPIGGVKLPTIQLQALSPNAAGETASTSAQVSKAGRKAYEKGREEAARQNWMEARKLIQKAVAMDPGYSAAWLCLGILQQGSGDRDGAQKSFMEAARTDKNFALPWIRLAALDAARADWPAEVEHSQKAIDRNPMAFPRAYELNTMGNLYLVKLDAAEKSATEGLQLDAGHEYPEFEYMLGAILKLKNDRDGAARHFKAYIDQAPDAAHVEAAKTELTRLQAGALN